MPAAASSKLQQQHERFFVNEDMRVPVEIKNGSNKNKQSADGGEKKREDNELFPRHAAMIL